MDPEIEQGLEDFGKEIDKLRKKEQVSGDLDDFAKKLDGFINGGDFVHLEDLDPSEFEADEELGEEYLEGMDGLDEEY